MLLFDNYHSDYNLIHFYCSIYRTRQDQIGGDILDMLLSFTDFMAFKEMFLEYKAVSIVWGLSLEKKLT